ncbi:lipoyl(octanoyl) transferase LipB [Aquirhabdus parva]|uniref:Octanoyltransferase n=1 Tax=Aquirhabdus parva TaxID=2283318 RepID=A0A345P6T6_9GAMM|nr:lipoyl(octanoyl) transferase LipB [Aquirhabdus parva]AXI02995.1 lipoyl(octanoyl) transferase LipB [Aquirhabdus parva]
MSIPALHIRHFEGLVDYAETYRDMRELTEHRDADTPDEVWLLQHQDVLTQGQAGKPEHILFNPLNLPIIQSDRGGQVTWHGKGQLVGYLLYDLNRLKWNVRQLVTNTENALIELLNHYDIDAYAKKDAPGVYVDEAKIGSLGFKIRHGRSYHGLSLNIDCDLAGFGQINPCGYAGLAMTRLIDQLQAQTPQKPFPSFVQVAQALEQILRAQHDLPTTEK